MRVLTTMIAKLMSGVFDLERGTGGGRPAARDSIIIMHGHKFILVRLRKATETSVEIVLSDWVRTTTSLHSRARGDVALRRLHGYRPFLCGADAVLGVDRQGMLAVRLRAGV